MAIMTTLSIMTIGVFSYVSVKGQFYFNYTSSIKAYFLASSGITYIGSRFYYDTTGPHENTSVGTPVTLPDGKRAYNFTLNDGSKTYTITVIRETDISKNIVRLRSTATVNNIARTITCEFDSNPEIIVPMVQSVPQKCIYDKDMPCIKWG